MAMDEKPFPALVSFLWERREKAKRCRKEERYGKREISFHPDLTTFSFVKSKE